MIYKFSEIKTHISSDTAVILGSGSSVNDITNEQWEKLKTFDLWALNNWVYHPYIVPNFYHIETKLFDAEIVKERLNEKWEQYKNVVYLLPATKPELVKIIGHEEEAQLYEYSYIKRELYKHCDAHYRIIPKGPIVRSYNASITALIDMIYKLSYKRIIFVGVDLYDSKYFWTGNDPIYGKVHMQWNKEDTGKGMNEKHQTHKISSFITSFNDIWMLPNNKEMFVMSKKSLLYPKIRYINI